MASADEIWLVDFGDPYPGAPAHHRPALALGPPGTLGEALPFVIVAPLTTTRRGLSFHVEIDDPATGLGEVSYVQCELIRSINRRRLVHRIGILGPDERAEVDRVVRILLGR